MQQSRAIKSFKRLVLAGLLFSLAACAKSASSNPPRSTLEPELVRGADLSRWPEISRANPVFKNRNSQVQAFLDILEAEGLNTVRLKLWHSPNGRTSSFAEVDSFAQVLKARGFKIWLSLHYSDTWADPGQQNPPAAWSGLEFQSLKDSIYQYTFKLSQHIDCDIIQIGNEINNGFIHPMGNRFNNTEQFKALLDAASQAVRDAGSNSQIMLHYAGFEGAKNFFNEIPSDIYDCIGLSYYPKWHGKSLSSLSLAAEEIIEVFDKDLYIAETAYPFTLDWNDWTNNIVGLESQLIPRYPATAQGQKEFLAEIRAICERNERIKGFCYWGGELIAWKGDTASNASPWENQALFNFDNEALTVLEVFNP